MEKERKPSKVVEAESNLRVVTLIDRVEELTRSATAERNQDIVGFFGPTKSGKSTLINCLMGALLMCIRDAYNCISIIQADEASGPKIGVSGQSETVKPAGYKNLPGTTYSMWDFAGFGDNKSTLQEILNAISHQAVLLLQNSVRFVLVVPYSLIESDDPLPFYKLLCELQKICPQIADSLCIVSTKGVNNTVHFLLKRAKSREFSDKENDNLDIINRAKLIIERVFENGTYVDFKAPVLEEGIDEKPFTLPNMKEFIDCINKLKAAKVPEFPILISDQAKHEISELYTVFYWEVKKDVEEAISLTELCVQKKIDEILEAKDENGKPASAAARHALFKSGKSTIEDVIEKSEGFKTFFVQVKEAGIGINDRFSENITKFRFIEKLKNSYKTDEEKSANRESEFFANIKVALMRVANKYSYLIANSSAATKKENREEEEWQKQLKDKIKAQDQLISKFKKDNDSVLVQTAMYLAHTSFAEMSLDAVEKISSCVIS